MKLHRLAYAITSAIYCSLSYSQDLLLETFENGQNIGFTLARMEGDAMLVEPTLLKRYGIESKQFVPVSALNGIFDIDYSVSNQTLALDSKAATRKIDSDYPKIEAKQDAFFSKALITSLRIAQE